ncbi:hypothetical protein PHSC3_000965 [Chlamydiales bacterium STE3]|nr:hypothetical protein PHSC3_000965 [Chlamydiales bacterium STE3]
MAVGNISELGSRAFHLYEGPTHQADKREKIGNFFYFFANVAFGKKIIFQKDGYSVQVRSLALRILAGTAAILCFELTFIGRILIESSPSHRLAFNTLVNMHNSSAKSHNSPVDSYLSRSCANSVIQARSQKGLEGLKKVDKRLLKKSRLPKSKLAVLNAPFEVTPQVLSSVKLKPIQPALSHASVKPSVNTSLSPAQAPTKQITKSSCPISSSSVPFQENLQKAHSAVAQSELRQKDSVAYHSVSTSVAHNPVSASDLLLNSSTAFLRKFSQLNETNASPIGEEESPIAENEWEQSVDDDRNGQFYYPEPESLNENPFCNFRSPTSKNFPDALREEETTSTEDKQEKTSCQELLMSSLSSLRLAIAPEESESEEEEASLDSGF